MRAVGQVECTFGHVFAKIGNCRTCFLGLRQRHKTLTRAIFLFTHQSLSLHILAFSVLMLAIGNLHLVGFV